MLRIVVIKTSSDGISMMPLSTVSMCEIEQIDPWNGGKVISHSIKFSRLNIWVLKAVSATQVRSKELPTE